MLSRYSLPVTNLFILLIILLLQSENSIQQFWRSTILIPARGVSVIWIHFPFLLFLWSVAKLDVWLVSRQSRCSKIWILNPFIKIKLFHIPQLTYCLLAYIAIEASHQNHCATSQFFISSATELSVKKIWFIRGNIRIFIELLKERSEKTVVMGWTRHLPGAARTCIQDLCISS